MQYNEVEICGVNTAQLPVLSHEEKDALLRRIKSGDQRAREEFINGNLRLVLSVIQRFQNRGENLDDLFQVGCIGLIKAIDNFNLSLGVKFSTYAVPMIIGELRRYLRDNNAIHVSRSLRDTAYKALSEREKIQREHARDATVDEIAGNLSMKREDVVMALDSIMDPVSLFEPIFAEGGDTLYVMDQLCDHLQGDDSWIDELTLKESIKNLSEREKRILSLRFFAGKTQTEVAKEVGISQAQVSRLEKNTIDRIKHQI